MEKETAGALSREFARSLGLDADTHEARIALGSVQLALLSLPQPDDWIYFPNEQSEGPPTALLLAVDRLIEVNGFWDESGPADLRIVGRRLVDGGAVIELEWSGAMIEGDVLHHTTSWAFNFPEGARVLVPGLVRSMAGEDATLDEGERFAREVASRLGQRPT